MRRDDFEYQTMPDALRAIECELRERAEEQAAEERPRGAAWFRGPFGGAAAIAVWPRPVGLVMAAVVVVTLAFLPGSLSRDSGTAFGQPAILQVKAVAVDYNGPNGKMTAARPFTVLGKRALLLSGEDQWCLSIPHRGPGELVDVPVVACNNTATFFRYGVTSLIGRTFVAALAAGVRAPQLKHVDGRKTTLRPDRLGVVAVVLKPGETVVHFGTNGRPRVAAHLPAGG